jgi:uncharacterized protein YaaQ
MENTAPINLLVILILDQDQLNDLTRKLVSSRFYFTQVNSAGGFLQRATVTLLVGINNNRYDELMEEVRSCCMRRIMYVPTQMEPNLLQSQPLMIEAEMGGAVVFALDIERFEQL